MKLLLLSTGGHPSRLFQHARDEIRNFLVGRRAGQVGFVTAAHLNDEDEYFARARNFFRRAIRVEAVHVDWRKPSRYNLSHLEAIVVGGGNTFVLLQRLRESGLLKEIRSAIHGSTSYTSYIGASAGANIAGPDILTTNDWNVIGAMQFDALGIVPWNINPHYPRRADAHGGTRFGEMRDERIAEFYRVEHPITGRVHRNPVAALEESAIIHVHDCIATVLGRGRVRWFEPDRKPRWFKPDGQLPPWEEKQTR